MKLKSRVRGMKQIRAVVGQKDNDQRVIDFS